MKTKTKKIISILLLISIMFSSLATPTPAYARISFKKFFRTLGRGAKAIGRGSRFVINLPSKATRWMGPVLGPIAATILTKNISKNPKWAKVFKHARKADKVFKTIEEKDKYLAEMKKAYHDQADELRKQAKEIKDSRKELLDELLKGDISFEDYKNNVVALDNISEVYKKAADKFDNGADNMRVDNIARIFSRDLLRQVWGQVKDAVIFESTKELNKLIDPNIIQKLISGEGVNLDTILDGLTSSHMDKLLGSNDYKDKDIDVDALKERVRERIKQILKENKEAFKKDWNKKVNEIIKNMIKNLDEEKDKLPVPSKESSPKPDGGRENEGTALLDDLLDFEDDGCQVGYKMDKKLGKCIQENCHDKAIKHAHWSHTGDCVCGSSGSMEENPEDPNKECAYSKSNRDCPGCVYACIHFNEDCPKKD
ncbi:hypothetical protein ACFLZ1_04990 [Patescibacteria group bacterium]